mgnify:CR=1 FL=1
MQAANNKLVYILQSHDYSKLHLLLLIDEIVEKDEPIKKFKNQDLALVTIDTSILSIYKKEITILSH